MTKSISSMSRSALAAAFAFALPAVVCAECCSRDAPHGAVPPVAIGAPGAHIVADGYGAGGPGYWQPGGYEGRIGSPYYYSAPGAGRQYWYGAMAGAPHHAAYVPGYGGWDSGPGGGYGAPGDPYAAHFGPGFQRHSNYGHYRFPYYSYRRPWYFPGPAVWNRDTNFAW
ncbi:MAG: hypothetical protein WD069_11310 [Planctomycetales bacterium]